MISRYLQLCPRIHNRKNNYVRAFLIIIKSMYHQKNVGVFYSYIHVFTIESIYNYVCVFTIKNIMLVYSLLCPCIHNKNNNDVCVLTTTKVMMSLYSQ